MTETLEPARPRPRRTTASAPRRRSHGRCSSPSATTRRCRRCRPARPTTRSSPSSMPWASVARRAHLLPGAHRQRGLPRHGDRAALGARTGRAIGYELSPGVAATTWLSVEVVPAPGGIDTFTIKAGTSAQSIPGPGELPQVFETVEEIVARPGWNSIPVVCEQPMAPAPGDALVRLAGTDLVLQPGDPILVLVGGSAPWFDLRRVAAASVVQAVLAAPTDLVALVPAHTEVVLDAPLVQNTATPNPASGVTGATVHVLRQRTALFGFNAPPWEALPVSLRVGDLDPAYGIENIAFDQLQVRRAWAAAARVRRVRRDGLQPAGGARRQPDRRHDRRPGPGRPAAQGRVQRAGDLLGRHRLPGRHHVDRPRPGVPPHRQELARGAGTARDVRRPAGGDRDRDTVRRLRRRRPGDPPDLRRRRRRRVLAPHHQRARPERAARAGRRTAARSGHRRRRPRPRPRRRRSLPAGPWRSPASTPTRTGSRRSPPSS